MRVRRLGFAAVAWVCVLAGWLALGGISAQAALVHPFIGSFGSGLSHPTGVAVDQATGNVFLADGGAGVVDVFGAGGGSSVGGVPSQITGLGSESREPEAVAVDNSCFYQHLSGAACTSSDSANGDVYLANAAASEVQKLAFNILTSEYERVGGFPSPEVDGVAVDQQGNVYVADYFDEAIPVFNPAGEEVATIAQHTIEHPAYIAVGAPGVVYVGNYTGGVAKIAVNSGFEVQSEAMLDPAGRAVAVDTQGDVFIDRESSLAEYDPSGSPLGVFAASGPGAISGSLGVASQAGGEVYASDAANDVVDQFGPGELLPEVTTGAASNLGVEGSATLNGTVNPEGVALTSCEFEYGTEVSNEQKAACTTTPSGASPVAVHADVSGLTPGTLYHYHLQASNANGTSPGDDQTFIAPALPRVDSVDVVGVVPDAATLQAQVNPGGADTTYRFEYGTSTSYGTSVPVPDGDAGPGLADTAVAAHVQGLTPGTTYYFRVTATNILGTVHATDQTFTTPTTTTGVTLPDGRVWELVSPPNKHGGVIEPNMQGPVIQAAVGGDAITYMSTSPIGSGVVGNPGRAQVLSRRGPEGGWSSQDISPPHDKVVALGAAKTEYQFFSSDLSLGLVQPVGETPLSPEASGRTVYLREANGSYVPLAWPGNTPAGTNFSASFSEEPRGIVILGATPDLSHVVLHSIEKILTPNAGPYGLYEWAGGRLQLVNVLSDGTQLEGSTLGDSTENVRHAISDDGSRIFWGDQNGHLYMRDVAKGETVQLDVAQGVEEPARGKARFQTASSDGSKVFFTDSDRLTADSTAAGTSALGNTGSDLYEFDVESGRLTDLTVDEHAGESAGVNKAVIGASEDGSYVYFAAEGALAAGAAPGRCTSEEKPLPPGATCNLYLRHDGTTTFIAALSSKDDENNWGSITGQGISLPQVVSRVSPDGRYLTFMSDRRLTGYDNMDASSGQPDEEVYLFDAARPVSSGNPVCVSCDPSGARPVGVLDSGFSANSVPLLVDTRGLWAEQWLAANTPGWGSNQNESSAYQQRFLSDSGRLFFDSFDGLVPRDTNGAEDVYEYEPVGVGGCVVSSATFSASSGGCVGLISSGTSGEESVFLDASESGDDVFFLTSAPLVSQDVDTSFDVYDAHVCSAAAPCSTAQVVSLPACSSGDTCRAAPSPPAAFGTPASAAFAGAGNVTQPASAPVVKAKKPKAKPKRKAKKKGKGKAKRRGKRARQSRVGKSLSRGTRR